MASDLLFDDSAERAVLGAVLVRNDALDEVLETLSAAHFRRQHHADLYRAMCEVHGRREPIDLVTLRPALARAGVTDVPPAYISGLLEGVPRSTNIAAYAGVVRESWLRRELLAVARRLQASAESDGETAAAILEETEQAVYRLGQTTVRSDWMSMAELVPKLTATLEDLAQHKGNVTGLATGLSQLDEMTHGLQPGDLVLLGARPSLGKTALASQIALHAARHVPVAFFSLEMSSVPLGLRALAGEARVNSWRLKSGYLSDVEYQRIGASMDGLAECALFIDETPKVNPVHVRSKLRRLQARVGRLGLVVIDYLQLLEPLSEHRKENKTNQVAGVSRALKILAREFDVPFLVLAQLNRGLEGRADKTPSLADLRDSGALEQDADVVLLLHRPGAFEPNRSDLRDVAQLIVGKHRNGPTGVIDLVWRPEFTRFSAQESPVERAS